MAKAPFDPLNRGADAAFAPAAPSGERHVQLTVPAAAVAGMTKKGRPKPPPKVKVLR